MAGLSARDPAVDRSLRSVFVGNIPYEATEEQLKDIFSEVGPVVSFRLVYDRETGKPKGYGFCEYQDQETALSAMRNLNGREFSGRALRVDNAASEKNKEELKSLGTGAPIIESPYGDPVNPEDAPESISRAVASLPPEQMFELMKQMKLCVQNSPQEARSMLLQNPQLAYALLQAQVVMRIVDPEITLKILHRQTSVPSLIPGNPQAGPGPGPGVGPGPGPNAPMSQPNVPASQPQPMGGMHVNGAPPMMQPPMQGGVPAPGQMPASVPGPGPLAPGGGMPGGGPMLLERGQVDNESDAFPSNAPSGNLQLSPVGPARPASLERVQVPMPDPRAPMQRGPMPASGPPPRGLLGDAPNDPRGGTLLSVTGEVEPRGYLGPPHQGPPMHHMPGHDNRGPPPHEMRGGPMGEPRPLMGEPRGPLMDGRGGRDPRGMEPRGMDGRGMEPRVMDARGMEPRGMEQRGMEPRGMEPRGMEQRGMEPRGMEPRGMEQRGMEPRGMEPRGMEQRGMEPRGMEPRGMEPRVMDPPRGMEPRGMEQRGMEPRVMDPPRGMEPRGMESRGPGPNPRGPMTGAIQGPGPLNMGASGPQGPRQVPNMPGTAMQTGGMPGAGVPAAGQPGGFSPGQNQVTPQDHEKAALIMQVLQLTADQIAMLPPEQRQSILILKEQIQKSTGAP
ncbi:cleavage stimulation factor subunit 2 isoform X2 [Hemicordylus capensis]|uniref:cleavage stimulation factor subunit 2 isoform X2 n=1 Tax=Hemicordylus capensis TaxID=884348 RepID=UPI0023023C4F|nr:cleavage stimulation factor subunit 2 isoform X2 [Hemicordylus capensis]